MAEEAQRLTGEKYVEVKVGQEITFLRKDLSVYPADSTIRGKSIEDYKFVVTMNDDYGDLKKIWKTVSSSASSVTLVFLKTGYYNCRFTLKEDDTRVLASNLFTVCVTNKDGSKPKLPDAPQLSLHDIPTIAVGDTIHVRGTLTDVIWPPAVNTIAVLKDGKMMDSWVVKTDPSRGQLYTPQEPGEYTIIDSITDQAGRSMEDEISFTVLPSIPPQRLTGIQYHEIKVGETITFLRDDLHIVPEGTGIKGWSLNDLHLWVAVYSEEENVDWSKIMQYETYQSDENTLRFLTPGYYVCTAIMRVGDERMITSDLFTVCVTNKDGSKPAPPEAKADKFSFLTTEDLVVGKPVQLAWNFDFGLVYPTQNMIAVSKDGKMLDAWLDTDANPRDYFIPEESGTYTVIISSTDQLGRTVEGEGEFTIQ